MNLIDKIGCIGLFVVVQGCYLHTETIDKHGTLEQTQHHAILLIAKELKEDPDLSYFEVFSTRSDGYGFVVNYNQELEVLTLEEDFCSGISSQFVEVTPAHIQRIAAQKLTFDQLRTVLIRRSPEIRTIDVPRLTC